MRKVIAVFVLIAAIGLGAAAGVLIMKNKDNNTQNSSVEDTPAISSRGTIVIKSHKGLTQFPKDILEDTDTTEIDLSNNKLTGAMPAEIRKLTKLTKLNVSYNEMTGVPAEIGQLSNLVELNYSYNKLTGLPLELGNLTKLEVLDLRGNDVSSFDLDKIRTKLTNTQILTD